jgi:hypothetical protein
MIYRIETNSFKTENSQVWVLSRQVLRAAAGLFSRISRFLHLFSMIKFFPVTQFTGCFFFNPGVRQGNGVKRPLGSKQETWVLVEALAEGLLAGYWGLISLLSNDRLGLIHLPATAFGGGEEVGCPISPLALFRITDACATTHSLIAHTPPFLFLLPA